MKKILFLLVFFMMISIVFLSSCKTAEETFNILGNWNMTLIYDIYGLYEGSITFAGTESSGVVIVDIDWPGTGNYTVTDRTVTISWTWSGETEVVYLTGNAITDNSMNGNFYTTEGYSGTWTATR